MATKPVCTSGRTSENSLGFMNYKKIAAVTIGLSICIFAASNAMAHGHGGGGLAAAAAVSVEPALAVVDSTVVGSMAAGFAAVLMAAGLALSSTDVTLPAAVFVATVISAAIGSAIVTSTISFSSGILGTRSFTIRMDITGTILTEITPTVTDTILTIHRFINAERDIPILWSVRSRSAWLVPAIIAAPSMA